MTQEQQEKIKELLLEVLQKMGFSAEVETKEIDDGTLFNLKTPDSAMLIGQHGANLGGLQYLVRLLSFRRLGEALHFVIDVEGYKESREEFLRELARQAASRVRDTKETLLLKPMAAYERRVVHSEISKLTDIETESVGDEPERRILIKPSV
jgi:spoIIIJ-associated protein